MRSVPSISPSRSSAVSSVCESDRRAIASPTTASSARLRSSSKPASRARSDERSAWAARTAKLASWARARLVRSTAWSESELQRAERRLTELERDQLALAAVALHRNRRCSVRIDRATRFRFGSDSSGPYVPSISRSPPRSRQRHALSAPDAVAASRARRAAAASSSATAASASPATSSGPPTSRPITAPSSHRRVASQARSPASIATLVASRSNDPARRASPSAPAPPSASSGTVRRDGVGVQQPAHELRGGLDRLGMEALDLGGQCARRRPDEPGDERAIAFRQPDDRDLGAGAMDRGFGDLSQDRIQRPSVRKSTAGPRERGERLGDVDASVDHLVRGRRGVRPHARS